MSRYNSGGSYGHIVRQIDFDHFRLGWVVDRYYATSRLRFPTGCTRDTDEEGAKRFAKKWGVEIKYRDPQK